MRNKEKISFNPSYPSVDSLREKTRKRIPKFAFHYLDGGCNEEVNLRKNTADLQEVELQPNYLDPYPGANLQKTLFGHQYDAPFGIAPVGLQGLIWPNSSEILARTAVENNLPFMLSTVATASIEKISEITEGKAWFQFYHPADNAVKDDLIHRAENAGCRLLVLLCDVPTFGFRPKEIRNGLAMPPKMNLSNILQMASHPKWLLETAKHGIPRFANLEPYMPKKLNLRQLGKFMDQFFEKRMNEDKIAAIRDRWQGKLLLKGVASEKDAEKAIKLGLDGLIVSNHGGRQLDAGESAIKSLSRIAKSYGRQIPVMMDSGLRSGPDVARAMASGAQFTFMGRAFMYGVAALGQKGGEHTVALLKTQLQQIMEQLGCSEVGDLPEHLL